MPRRPRLAGLAGGLVLAAERAVLAQFHPVRVVTPVLPGDVVAVLALLAGQRDLGPDISRSHVEFLSFLRSNLIIGWGRGQTARAPDEERPGCPGLFPGRVLPGHTAQFVAEAGLEPGRQRL